MNVFSRIKVFFMDAFAELSRVQWPERREAVRHTVYIIISVAVAAAIVSGLDILLTKIIERLLK